MLLPLKAIISKKPRKDGKSTIYFQYCYSSTNRVLLNTEQAIPSQYWNTKRQCVSKSLPTDVGDFDAINKEVSRIQKIIQAIIEHGVNSGADNIGEYVKSTYSPQFDISTLTTTVFSAVTKREPEFFVELEKYISSKEKKVCEKGHANFRSLTQHFKAYQEFSGKKITFSSIDYNFYTSLVEFFTYDYQLSRKRIPEFGLKLSTIGCIIKRFRGFIKDRVRRKIISPIDLDDFKILDEESDAIYLSYEEVGRIYQLDLSSDPTLELYRDMFVLGCLSGLRFSDYSTLLSSDIRNGMLYKKTEKKDSWVVIPLRKEAQEIVQKRLTAESLKISNPLFNRYIKVIAKMAGITELVTFSYKKGNKMVSSTKPKHEFVTSHTCRRSFCTCEYLAGTEVSLIMKISGHKTFKDFFKYIRITQEEAARQIQLIWNTRNNMQVFDSAKAG